MWSTFFVTDEEGHMVNPAATGTMAAGPPGGPPQGAGGLANLMSGRTTFGGNKRRRQTSTGNTMSEAQEGKVLPCECLLRLCGEKNFQFHSCRQSTAVRLVTQNKTLHTRDVKASLFLNQTLLFLLRAIVPLRV